MSVRIINGKGQSTRRGPKTTWNQPWMRERLLLMLMQTAVTKEEKFHRLLLHVHRAVNGERREGANDTPQSFTTTNKTRRVSFLCHCEATSVFLSSSSSPSSSINKQTNNTEHGAKKAFVFPTDWESVSVTHTARHNTVDTGMEGGRRRGKLEKSFWLRRQPQNLYCDLFTCCLALAL